MYNRAHLEFVANHVIRLTWLRFRKIYPQLPKKHPRVVIKTYLREDMACALVAHDIIKIEEPYFRENYDFFCSDVIPHEVAHCVAYKVYGDDGHGKKWRKCMRQIDLEPIEFYLDLNIPFLSLI